MQRYLLFFIHVVAKFNRLDYSRNYPIWYFIFMYDIHLICILNWDLPWGWNLSATKYLFSINHLEILLSLYRLSFWCWRTLVEVVFYSGFWNWQRMENDLILHLIQPMLKNLINPWKVLYKISDKSNSAIVLQCVLDELYKFILSPTQAAYIFSFWMISKIEDISSISFSMLCY